MTVAGDEFVRYLTVTGEWRVGYLTVIEEEARPAPDGVT
jgi:hypothetical protein